MGDISTESITILIPNLIVEKDINTVLTESVRNNWDTINSSILAGAKNDQITPKEQYKNDILRVIVNDTFEDGVVSKSEEYINETISKETCEDIKAALMDLYLSNLNNPHILTGLLTMIGSIKYNDAVPQCPIMALGLLQNKDISVRDKAIQVFERWNSKAGIPILQSLNCDKKWLQRYVDKVIMYLERDGED